MSTDEPIDAEVLRAELKRLRKGTAMRHPEVATRLEPQTRAAFGVLDDDKVPTIRAKAKDRVSEVLADDDPRRAAALAALALHADAFQRLLKDRESWLAGQLHCDERTARRRVNEAINLLVDRLAEADHIAALAQRASDDGYVVRTFWATMRLDRDRPELHEKREIVVTGDRLEVITIRFTVPQSVPGANNDVDLRAGEGGEIAATFRRSPEHFEFALRLPRLLRHGERHVYDLTFSIPDGQPMRPHYVFQPLVPCQRFELSVRFDPGAMPTDIWLIDGVAPRLLDHDQPSATRLEPTPTAAVRRSFVDLRQGLAYGVGWRPKAT